MECEIHHKETIPLQPQLVKKIQHYLFKWSNRIGKGNFSEVYLGVNEKTEEQVAIKVIKNQAVKSKTAQRLLNCEINILKHLDHPCVIKCYDVISSINNCYIITEYCQGGDLQKILRQKKYFQEQQITKIVYDTYKGLQYLNENFILHRDFKIANIFLQNGNFKIADFGFAIRAKTLFADIPVGSPVYMSPEGLINNNYGPKTDVWSFGIMLYQLLHGEAPLDKYRSEQELKLNIIKKPLFRKNLSKQITDLIEKCLQPHVNKRISIPEIKQTAFMKKIFSLYEIPSIIPEKLTQTFHSTETSNSTKQNLFSRDYTYDQTLSLIHYGRFLNKCIMKTHSKIFSQWLLSIFEGLIKCKIVRSTQNSPKNLNSKNAIPQNRHQSLKQVVQEYYRKYNKQHISSKIMFNYPVTFEDILTQCTKLYKEFESKNGSQQMKNIVFLLYKQTQLLNQSFKDNKMDYFAKHSQAVNYLNGNSKNMSIFLK